MQIFVRNFQGKTITLNVESHETICSVKRMFKEKEGIHIGLHLGLEYAGKLLEDELTLAHYNILKESTLMQTSFSVYREYIFHNFGVSSF